VSASRPAAPAASTTSTSPVARQWMPHQHGAWAMLAVPFLLGIAASTPSAWQIVLGVASVIGYLASATGQAWLRARKRDPFTVPLAVYGVVFGVLGLALVVAFPALLASLVVLGPTTAMIVAGAKPGTRRDLANSFAQSIQALVLAPAAALVSGSFETTAVVIATAVGAAYLLGTVLVVRSVLRERNSTSFTLLSIGFHAAFIVPALVLGLAWLVLALALTVRAWALPTIARRRFGTPKPLKPVHVGAIEAVMSIAVVLVAFLALP
jgi:hypothetical protein